MSMNDAQLLTVRVIDRSVEAEGIVSFQLANSNGEHLPPVEAGAHIDVHLPHGLVRQYSLCNTPGETRVYQIAVLREEGGRGGSTYMHESVPPAGFRAQDWVSAKRLPIERGCVRKHSVCGWYRNYANSGDG
jgi:NAD(P)H-flavin reductase